MDVVVSKSRLRPILFVLMGLVVSAGVAVEVLRPVLGLRTKSGVLPLLSMSYEGNVPTFYTSALLGLVALLCAVSAAGAKRHAAHFGSSPRDFRTSRLTRCSSSTRRRAR